MPTAAELRVLAAKARRLMVGHTPADVKTMEAYAEECEAKAAAADVATPSGENPPRIPDDTDTETVR